MKTRGTEDGFYASVAIRDRVSEFWTPGPKRTRQIHRAREGTRVAVGSPVARTNDARREVNFERNDDFPRDPGGLRGDCNFRDRRPDARPGLLQER
jgi:hypothetical protein